jgi:hypothetical protein
LIVDSWTSGGTVEWPQVIFTNVTTISARQEIPNPMEYINITTIQSITQIIEQAQSSMGLNTLQIY